jgi:hypothetical protein
MEHCRNMRITHADHAQDGIMGIAITFSKEPELAPDTIQAILDTYPSIERIYPQADDPKTLIFSGVFRRPANLYNILIIYIDSGNPLSNFPPPFGQREKLLASAYP